MVVRAHHGSWVMVKGTSGCHRLWAVGSHCGCHHLCPFMGAGHHLGAVAAGCGRPWLGGSFLGPGDLFHGRSMSSWSNESLGMCWLVMWLAMLLSSWLVVVVSRW